MLFSFDISKEQFPPVRAAERIRNYEEQRRLYDGLQSVELPASKQPDGTASDLVNFHRMLGDFWREVVAGEPPVIATGDESLDALVENSHLTNCLPNIALDLIRFGDAVVRIRVRDNMPIVQGCDPAIWYPVVDRADIWNRVGTILMWSYRSKEQENDIVHNEVKAEGIPYVGASGTADRLRVIQFDDTENKGKVLDYTLTNRVIGSPIATVEEFDYDFSPIVSMHFGQTNDRITGQSSFADIGDLAAAYQSRLTGIKRIMEQHTSPAMYGDESAVKTNPDTGEQEVGVAGQFFPVPPGGVEPGYLTWDANLEQNFEYLTRIQDSILVAAGVSPGVMGLRAYLGSVVTGSALRRVMFRQIVRTMSLRRILTDGIRRVVLSIAAATGKSVKYEDIAITWSDFVNDEIDIQRALELYDRGIIDAQSTLARTDQQTLAAATTAGMPAQDQNNGGTGVGQGGLQGKNSLQNGGGGSENQ